jgi:hypothetical protein
LQQVNEWLADSKVIVRKTNVAFKAMREWGPSMKVKTFTGTDKTTVDKTQSTLRGLTTRRS